MLRHNCFKYILIVKLILSMRHLLSKIELELMMDKKSDAYCTTTIGSFTTFNSLGARFRLENELLGRLVLYGILYSYSTYLSQNRQNNYLGGSFNSHHPLSNLLPSTKLFSGRLSIHYLKIARCLSKY